MTKLEKPSARIQKATKAEAQERTKSLKRDYRALETGWMNLGRDARIALDRHVPEALGMGAQDWLVSVFGESIAKIKRALRIEAGLRTLPDAEVKQLSEGNAYNLTRLPEKERTAPEMVAKAKALAKDQFQHVVDTRLANLRGQADAPEQFITFRVSLPKSVYEELKEAEEKMAEAMEVDLERPSGRITTWKGIANLINTTPIERVREETVGGD